MAHVRVTHIRNYGCIAAPRKGCLIRFKQSRLPTDLVFASSAEIQGEHLIFLREDGSLVAVFPLDLVESWSEVEFQTD